MIPVKSLTVLACLALPGIALAPVDARAASAVHITPSIGHPVMFDLRDQVRFPKVQGPIASDDSGLPPVRPLRKPVHAKPVRGN
jgi:hypothetical protein